MGVVIRGALAQRLGYDQALLAEVAGALARAVPADPEEASSLEAELALLRAARAALTQGDTATTLRLVADHARRFMAGHLAEERMVLRVQALCERGEREQSREAVRQLLAAYPNSPHAGTLAAACRDE